MVGSGFFLSFKSVNRLASRLIFLPDVDCLVLSFCLGLSQAINILTRDASLTVRKLHHCFRLEGLDSVSLYEICPSTPFLFTLTGVHSAF